jgi:hypothetical protein
MAASGDMDRVLPAMLSSPCERLPLPSLCSSGGATRAKANTTPCHHDDLTGDPARLVLNLTSQ